MSSDILLEVDNLRTYFFTRAGIVKAVDGVSFQLYKGKTLGIVGESGSGKSVTMMSILGLIPKPPGKIVSGRAYYRQDLCNVDSELRRIREKNLDDFSRSNDLSQSLSYCGNSNHEVYTSMSRSFRKPKLKLEHSRLCESRNR